MRILEFVIQLSLALVALISLIFFYGEGEALAIAAMAQLGIGITQLISASVHTLRRDFKYPLNTRVNIYWIGTVLYFIALVTAAIQSVDIFHPAFMAAAWGLAIYYGYLTYQLIINKSERGKFLPNLDFYA